jgi:hypothetical protein
MDFYKNKISSFVGGHGVFLLVASLSATLIFALVSATALADQAIKSKPQVSSALPYSIPLQRGFVSFEQPLRVREFDSGMRVRYSAQFVKRKYTKRADKFFFGARRAARLEIFGKSCDHPLQAHVRVVTGEGRYEYYKFTQPVSLLGGTTVRVEYLGKKRRMHRYRISLGEETLDIPSLVRIDGIKQHIVGATLYATEMSIQ